METGSISTGGNQGEIARVSAGFFLEKTNQIVLTYLAFLGGFYLIERLLNFKSHLLLWSKLHLQAHEEISENLVFAFAVLMLGRIAEKSAELVGTKSKAS